MAIVGVHLLVYTAYPERVRAVLRDVLAWPSVDAGDGWLIFRLPPAEVGVHPAETGRVDVALMCDDVTTTLAQLSAHDGIEVGGVRSFGWGTGAEVTLAPDVRILLYQPAHPVAATC